MAGWQLDARRFAEEVFVPVRDGWDVGHNLFRFFQLPLDVSDDAVIDQAVKGVDAHLKRHSLAGVHKQVASTLRPAFPDHARTMRETARRTQHRGTVLGERRALAARVRDDMRGLPALRTTELDHYVARYRAVFVRREIEEALDAARIAVRDPVPLAVPPQPARWTETRLPLRALGHTSLAGYLTAHRLTAQAAEPDVRRVRAELDRLRGAESLTAEETVLGMVERLVSAGTLADALRRELIDELCDAAERGIDALGLALARPDITQRATAIGLPNREDLAYALLCRVRPVGDTDGRWREEVDQALADRELRTAAEILATRPNLPAELADLRTQIDQKLGGWTTSWPPQQPWRPGTRRPPQCATPPCCGSRTSPRPRPVCARCRPPAPPAVRARVEGDRVVVTWEPAPIRAGEPRYRVVRRVDGGPGAGRTEIAHTPDTMATDPDAPAGVPVIYEVSTVREGAASAPVGTGPVVVLRPVVDLVATSGDGEVHLRWRLPETAVAVCVHRIGDDGRVEIPAGTTTAHDPTALSGRHYSYTVEAAYDRDGTRVLAPPAVVDAHPQAPPDVVTDLQMTEEPGGTAVVSWTPPAHGTVLPARHPPRTAAAGHPAVRRGRDRQRGRGAGPGADGPAGRAARRRAAPLGGAAHGGRGARRGRPRGRARPPAAAGEEPAGQPPGTAAAVVVGVAGPDRRCPRAGPRGRPGRRARRPPRQGRPDLAGRVRAERVPRRRPPPGCRTGWLWDSPLTTTDRSLSGRWCRPAVSPPASLHYTVLSGRRGRRTLVVVGEPPLPGVQLRARVTFPPLHRDEGDILAHGAPPTPRMPPG